ncbi:hypothetical protein CEXT_413381 [Caerostris extrusa]|uniref:Uncharacterized protein n=1 Tax=Caerostris extrusa TaxID=172846 RepID=A0AAV4MYY9_CAEEX|nr:hypothetical protein CEXT_413381 [Caerostris extrusa]
MRREAQTELAPFPFRMHAPFFVVLSKGLYKNDVFLGISDSDNYGGWFSLATFIVTWEIRRATLSEVSRLFANAAVFSDAKWLAKHDAQWKETLSSPRPKQQQQRQRVFLIVALSAGNSAKSSSPAAPLPKTPATPEVVVWVGDHLGIFSPSCRRKKNTDIGKHLPPYLNLRINRRHLLGWQATGQKFRGQKPASRHPIRLRSDER